MIPNLVESAIHITVQEANKYRPARARVSYYAADGTIKRSDYPVSQVDALIADIEATGVSVEQTQMWKRLEIAIDRPRPQRPVPVMTDADREWYEQQKRMAACAPRKARGARASAWNRVTMARGRGNR